MSARRGPMDARLLRVLPALCWWTAASVTSGLGASAAVAAQALGLAHLVASVLPGAAHADRALWASLLAGGVAGRALLAALNEWLASRSAGSTTSALRRQVLLADLSGTRTAGPGAGGPGPGGPDAGGPDAGSTAALAGKGLDALETYVGRCLPDLVLGAAAPVCLLVAVGALDWLSALVLVTVVALFPVFGALVGRSSMSLAKDRWSRVEELGRKVVDLFLGLPTLKAFGRVPAQREALAAADAALRRSSSKVLRVAFMSALVLDTLASLSVALVAVPLGLRLLDGSVPLSSALAVLVLAPEVLAPLRRASAEFHESTEGLAALDRVLELAVPAPAPARPWDRLHVGAPVSGTAPAVALRSVKVPRGPDGLLFGSLDLDLAAGQTVVVTGANGTGKTTLLSLLLGSRCPSEGSITVDGTDLRALDRDGWFARLTYLPENPVAISGSLADNLRLAAPAATPTEMSAALVRAGGGRLLEDLHQSLDTPVGPGGRSLSAGELQRVAIARCLLRSRTLYLLDEPTSHLDADSEAAVVSALKSALAGATAVIVSHRPALQALADRVLELEDGAGGTVVREAAVVAWAKAPA